jgi:anti-anti-sigma factor
MSKVIKNASLDFTWSENRNKLIITLTGYLDSDNSPKIGALIMRELESKSLPGDIICDITGISYLSSTGIAMFMNIHAFCTEHESRLYLLGMSQKIRDVFIQLGFEGYFAIINSLTDIRPD